MTKPLVVRNCPLDDLRDYIGYRFEGAVPTENGYASRMMTITVVHGPILPGDPARVEVAEYPGYHIDFDKPVTLWAPVCSAGA